MLQIRLLGQFDLRLDGQRIFIQSRSGQSLLAYLALTADTPHPREKLARMFWPTASEESAHKNLRRELWRIRKLIATGETTQPVDYFLAEPFTIRFNPKTPYWLDVKEFERAETELPLRTSNLSFYQGKLLPGFDDDWVGPERERLQALFDSKMEQLIAGLISAECWTDVQEQAERWLALGNRLEPAYRALLLAYGACGDLARVDSIYQRYLEELDEHFVGVEPSTEIRTLYQALHQGTHPSQRQVPTSRPVTFLFTDIEGSTNLLEQLGDQYTTLLAQHHAILRAAIQTWHGDEVHTQGDSFFVTFPHALEAVQCVAEVQRAFAEHDWPHRRPLRVRMGLHTGELLSASTGHGGMDVHRAARIGDAAHGGQVLLSLTTAVTVYQHLPPGLSLQELGEYRLKDLKFPMALYQLVMEGLPHKFPPPRTRFAGTEDPTPGEPPFKGLQYFEEADAELFFGRELFTAKLVKRLQEPTSLLVIIGASGSGKSSLVRAGLIPILKKGDVLLDGTKPPADSAKWRVYILTPTAHPLEALATELTREPDSALTATMLMEAMSQDPHSLAVFLARQHPQQHSVLVLDQFEELFTLCHDEFEREAFIDNLLATLQQPESNTTLIFTLRADFYAHLAQYPELRNAVAKHQEYVGPMRSDELRRAIEEPARRGHWAFEPGLVDLILRDVGDEPGALPLLSHALLETWQRRTGHILTLKGYASAGGVRGAIAHTAESVYQHLSPDEQAIARNIFLRLTELGEGTEDTRRRATLQELISHAEQADEVRSALNRLAEARLVTLGDDTAEVAHEALIREWPMLREWLNEDREGLKIHRHLTEAAHEWARQDRDPNELYRGARLAAAREWDEAHPADLNPLESEYLRASQERVEREKAEREAQQQRELEAVRQLAEEQMRAASRLRVRNRIITVVGAITLVVAVLAIFFGNEASQNATRAQTNFSAAQSANTQSAESLATAQAASTQSAESLATAQAASTQSAESLATAQAAGTQAIASAARAESLRLASEANSILNDPVGNAETAALLSLRSLQIAYSAQADAALVKAFPHLAAVLRFAGHTGAVTSVAFSPDGKYMLTGSGDTTARLWDARTSETLRTFIGHTGLVYSVAFSPDGKYVLTGSRDTTARLWDAQTGKELRTFTGHTDTVSSVAFSLDGKTVLTGSWDTTARLWDAETGKELRTFTGHLGTVWSVAFSPDGKYVLTGSDDTTARLWDLRQTGKALRIFTGHTDTVWNVAFSPDGKTVLTGSDDTTARLWNVQTGETLRTFTGHLGTVWSVAFSPDGKYVLTGSWDTTVRLWNVETGETLRIFTGHADAVSSVAFSPDGKSMLTGSWDATARLWNLRQTGEALRIFTGHTDAVRSVAFSPDGKSMLTGSWDTTARLWDLWQTGETLHTFTGHTDNVSSVAFSPDGKSVLTGSYDQTARLWDLRQTGETLHTFTGHTDLVWSVAFSPDGKTVLTGSWDNTARLWDLRQTGETLRTFTGHTDDVSSVAFSPDGKTVLTGSWDTTARLWDIQTGETLRTFAGHTDAVRSVAFSPDGKYVLTGSDDTTARLWDAETGKELRPFTSHTDAVSSVAFSPDGKYVLTGSADHTARLWDAETGGPLRTFTGHTDAVSSVAFSPDGKYVLTGSADHTTRLWNTNYQDFIRDGCSHLVRDFTDAERLQYDIEDDKPTCSN